MSLLMSFALYLYFYGFIIAIPETRDSVRRVGAELGMNIMKLSHFNAFMSAMRKRWQ